VLEPTPAWTLEEVLDGIAAAGFAGVGLDHYTVGAFVRAGGRVDDLGRMLRTRGLSCTDVGVVPLGDGDVVDAAHELARVARATGATLCIAALLQPIDDAVAIRQLDAAAEPLAGAGVRLAFEFTAYGHTRTLADAIRICGAVGWERCGLLVDTWHVFRGGEPMSLLRSVDGEQVALVHVNDGPSPSEIDPVFEGRFRRLAPGTGTFALDAFAAALDEIGYRGPISVEVLSSELRMLPPAEGARQLMRSLRAWV
jgi:sugar phosphate isomerase/epimerase